ncbi:hypothetical protein BU26DRAFT_524326, partial [Trematosphaeria pertusa]
MSEMEFGAILLLYGIIAVLLYTLHGAFWDSIFRLSPNSQVQKLLLSLSGMSSILMSVSDNFPIVL